LPGQRKKMRSPKFFRAFASLPAERRLRELFKMKKRGAEAPLPFNSMHPGCNLSDHWGRGNSRSTIHRHNRCCTSRGACRPCLSRRLCNNIPKDNQYLSSSRMCRSYLWLSCLRRHCRCSHGTMWGNSRNRNRCSSARRSLFSQAGSPPSSPSSPRLNRRKQHSYPMISPYHRTSS
jgi:hypothetical protein